jgi:hypothetical protein
VKKVFVFGNLGKFQQIVESFMERMDKLYEVLTVPSNKVADIYIAKYVDLNQLEKKFGGKMTNLEIYWPPRCQLDGTKILRDEILLKHEIQPFCFEEKKYKIYQNRILGN